MPSAGWVLAPTDPVFAAAIVGRKEVPGRLRHLLNVESGLNDGLALPIVLVLLALGGGTDVGIGVLAEEIALGLLIGVLVPLIVIWLERLPFLMATKGLQPLVAVSIGLLVLAICLVTGANLFLASFSAGITVATAGPGFREEFEQFGELVSELLKLAAILVFGALITPTFLFGEIAWAGWVFAVLAIVVARPLALLVSFLGTRLPQRNSSQPCGSVRKGSPLSSTGFSFSNQEWNAPTRFFTSWRSSLCCPSLPILNRRPRRQTIRQPPSPHAAVVCRQYTPQVAAPRAPGR